MSCICVGPKGSGKTHLLRALQDPVTIDESAYSSPTVGISFYTIHLKHKNTKFRSTSLNAVKDENPSDHNNINDGPYLSQPKIIEIMEIGGTMAPIWRQYFRDVKKLIYVVDTSNLCQISSAGVLLYSILTEPRLQQTKILLVLTKMDYAYRQMRNEALLMLQMTKLQKEISQKLTIIETSSVTKIGLDDVHEWLQTA